MKIYAVDVSGWFVENALLLNPDETEAVVFGTRKRLPQLHLSRGIDVSGTRIDFVESIKLLGVVLDASLTFEKTCAGCRTWIMWMPCSHQSTTAHQTTSDIGRRKDLRCSHRHSRLDYCNSLLQGTSAANLDMQTATGSGCTGVCRCPGTMVCQLK